MTLRDATHIVHCRRLRYGIIFGMTADELYLWLFSTRLPVVAS